MLQSKDQQLRKIEEEVGGLHEEDSFARKMVSKAASDAQENIVKDAVKSLNPEQKREIVTSTIQQAASDAQENIVKDAVKSLNPEKQEELANKLLPDINVINKIWLIVIGSLSLALVISVVCLAISIFLKTNPNVQMLLTVFATSIAFFGGLLTPSPAKR